MVMPAIAPGEIEGLADTGVEELVFVVEVEEADVESEVVPTDVEEDEDPDVVVVELLEVEPGGKSAEVPSVTEFSYGEVAEPPF